MGVSVGAVVRTLPAADTRQAERLARRLAGLALLCFGLLGTLGLAWDIQWHVSAGRDRFLTPPHVAIYAAVLFGGLVCLGGVLLETWRYARGAGVDDGNSVRVLGLFHAPLGLVVAGFGCLALLLSAPLDNLWHELYGIDVAIWTPFHLMGLIGAFIAQLGTVYLWGTLLVEARRTAGERNRLGPEAWGSLVALMLALVQLLTIASPAIGSLPTTDIGSLRILTYPVLLGLFVPWVLLAAVGLLGRASAAGLLIGLVVLRDLLFQLLVPWLVQVGAAVEGFAFRSPAAAPTFRIFPLLLDLGLLLAALLVGLAARRRPVAARHGGEPAAVGALCGLVLWLATLTLFGWPPAGWPALPAALACGALSGLVGHGLGQVLRLNRR